MSFVYEVDAILLWGSDYVRGHAFYLPLDQYLQATVPYIISAEFLNIGVDGYIGKASYRITFESEEHKNWFLLSL